MRFLSIYPIILQQLNALFSGLMSRWTIIVLPSDNGWRSALGKLVIGSGGIGELIARASVAEESGAHMDPEYEAASSSSIA